VTCGIPLEATDADHCAACLAAPPPIDRTRAVLGYDDTARQLALNLKYGRKVALARTMARYMDTLRGEWGDESLIVPVPLHRRRLWWRGFNQAGLVARHLSRQWSLPVDHHLLLRRRPTRSLKGLTQRQRHDAVRGAFAVRDGADVAGRTVILVDDVLASGATSESCARVLRRAGAARVELVTWARVVRPAHLVR
jgi:ComF family protein